MPANTLVQAALVGEDYLVEIEADADLGDADAQGRQSTSRLN
jgi:hypothetical protein